MHLLVTRPEPGNRQTCQRLKELGHRPLPLPLLQFTPTSDALPSPAGFAAVALTSANAITALEKRKALDPWLHLPAFAVGDRTTEAARRAGFAETFDAEGSVGDLADLILTSNLSGRVFYPAARHRAGDLELLLERGGQSAETVPVYEMSPVPREHLPQTWPYIDGALHYSRRSAEAFLAIPNLPKTGFHLCLSANVAAPLREAGLKPVRVAAFPDEEAMLSALLSLDANRNKSG